MRGEKSILQMYLDQLVKFPVISREEEKHLARRAKEGDEQAAEKLIISNLRFVVRMAFKHRNMGLPLVDLINEGNIGLIKALNKFDPDRDLRFISFARWWVRHYILKALFEQTSAIRIPIRHAPSLMKDRDNSARKRQELKNAFRPLSLDQLLLDEENSETVMAFVGSDRYGLTEENLMRKTMEDLIEDVMLKLKPMERQIIRWHYGLGGLEPLTLGEIGKRYSLTKERIRQIMHAALIKIKYPMEKREILAFVS